MKKLLLLLSVLTVAVCFSQSGVLRDGCIDAGSNDTYACNYTTAPTWITGHMYWFKANTANTGAASINFNSAGAKTIKKVAGGVTTDLDDNDIRANQWVTCIYDGTNCQMTSQLGNSGGGGGGTTLTGYRTLFGGFTYSGNSGMTVNGAVGNRGMSFAPVFDGTRASTTLTYTVQTAGTSGAKVIFAFYPVAMTAPLCVSAVGVFDTTGAHSTTWASGSGVSGGTCTTTVETRLVMSSDDAGGKILVPYEVWDQMTLMQPGGTSVSNTVFGQSTAAVSTGTAGSLAMITDLSAVTFTASGLGPPLMMQK